MVTVPEDGSNIYIPVHGWSVERTQVKPTSSMPVRFNYLPIPVLSLFSVSEVDKMNNTKINIQSYTACLNQDLPSIQEDWKWHTCIMTDSNFNCFQTDVALSRHTFKS